MKALFWSSVQSGRICFAVAFSFLLGQLMRELAIFIVHWMLRDWKEYLALLSC